MTEDDLLYLDIGKYLEDLYALENGEFFLKGESRWISYKDIIANMPEIEKFNNELTMRYGVPENLHYLFKKNTYYNFFVDAMFCHWLSEAAKAVLGSNPHDFVIRVKELRDIIIKTPDTEEALDNILKEFVYDLPLLSYILVSYLTHRLTKDNLTELYISKLPKMLNIPNQLDLLGQIIFSADKLICPQAMRGIRNKWIEKPQTNKSD